MRGCQSPSQKGQIPPGYDSLRICHLHSSDILKKTDRQSVQQLPTAVPTCGREMIERSPVPSVTDLYRWEVDCVEICVVFAHELIEMYVVGIQPPLLPLGCEIRGDTRVSYRCVELEAIRQYIVMIK